MKNNSGRFSPIESPKRKIYENEERNYIEDNYLKSNSVSNIPSPPSSPPLYSSHSFSSSPAPSYTSSTSQKTSITNKSYTNHINSSSKSTYSNLMNYLNEINDNNKIIDKSSSHIDDLSTISNSLNSMSKEKSLNSRQYVWDEDNNFDSHSHHSIPSSSSSTITANGIHNSHYQSLFKPFPNDRSDINSSDSSVSSKANSLKNNFDEVKRKVDIMKSELKIKNQTIKELQSELSRIIAIRG